MLAVQISCFLSSRAIPSEGNPPDVSLIDWCAQSGCQQRNKYLPYRMPGQLNKWLAESIVDIEVEEFGLLIRNSPPRFDSRFTDYPVDDENQWGHINYDPQTGLVFAMQTACYWSMMFTLEVALESGTDW